MTRLIVVDDEEPARRRLIRMLAQFQHIEVVGEAENGEDALRLVEASKPDAMLLDIQMPRLDGLSLAQRFTDLPPIVFVTAHAEHAVAAFEVHAVDYLLKPVRAERLKQAIDRISQLATQERVAMTAALEAVAPSSESTRIITVSQGIYRFFDAHDIHRFWSSDKYTVFLANGEEHLTEESLSSLEARLSKLGFLRVHRAELVRLSSIRALRVSEGDHSAELKDGQLARVSRRSISQVRQALGL